MKRLLLLVAVGIGFVLPTLAQQAIISDEPLSDPPPPPPLDVTLDPNTRTVDGRQRLTWRNPDNVPVDELQFHLYLNAFKPGSTFMKETGGSHRGFTAGGEDTSGGIQISSMRIATDPVPADAGTMAVYASEETDLTERIRFIQTTSNNPDDETVIAVQLPRAVQPGETIALDIDFAAKMPKIFARTGWEDDQEGGPFFMVAQWFPKIGVYEVPGQRYVPADAERGQWSTHQFHANTEFYADFGTYDVTINVPETYTVGASGVLVEEAIADSMRTVTYRAEDVHDFAWTASDEFLEFNRTWRHVNLRLLIQPIHVAQVDRHFNSAIAALERFDAWVGEYPYTTLTLVDGIGGSNGMEYPTLITCGTVYQLPTWARPLELVTVHEFGHQYFYGLLASNEAEEAWLDEGMTSYLEARIMDDAYGEASVLDLPFLQTSDRAMQRLSYTKSRPSRGKIFEKAWEHRFSSDYGKQSYAKPATVMFALEGYLGWETMQRFLQTYYDRWRFRHPTTRDLIDVAEEVAGEDLGWFFDQFVYSNAVVDYAVEYVNNDRIDPPASADSSDGDWYRTSLLVKRLEDGIFPQEIRVRFADDSERMLEWDGEDQWKLFTFEQPSRAIDAFLDPDDKVALDINRLNNRRTSVLGGASPIARHEHLTFTTRIQQFLLLVTALF